EGLGHVIIGAALQTGHRIGHRGTRGEDDHRNVHAPATDLGQHVETVPVRQTDVQYQQIELPGACQIHCLGTGGHRGGGVARRTQTLTDEGGDPLLVLGNENLTHSVSCISTASGTTARGTTTVNVLPAPTSDSSSTRPPCAWAISDTMDNPSPVPSTLRSRRVNRVKTRCWSCAEMPTPSSRTHSRTSWRAGSYREPIAITESSPENFTALEANCSHAWVSRCSSPSREISATSSSRHCRCPSCCALVRVSSVSCATSTVARTMKSGRRARASEIGRASCRGRA